MSLEERIKETVIRICTEIRWQEIDSIEFALDRAGATAQAADIASVEELLAVHHNTQRLYFNNTPPLKPLHETLCLLPWWHYIVAAAIYCMPACETKNNIARGFGATIGKGVTLERGVYLDLVWPQLIDIGDNVTIRKGAFLYTHYQQRDSYALGPISIGGGTIIDGELILLGTTIGKHAHIHKGAMLGPSNIRNIPDNAVAYPSEDYPIRLLSQGIGATLCSKICETVAMAPRWIRNPFYRIIGVDLAERGCFPSLTGVYSPFGEVHVGEGTKIGGWVTFNKYVIGEYTPKGRPYTIIGKDVVIGTGAKIGVDVTIEDNVQIDAGAIVPSGTVIRAGQRIRNTVMYEKI